MLHECPACLLCIGVFPCLARHTSSNMFCLLYLPQHFHCFFQYLGTFYTFLSLAKCYFTFITFSLKTKFLFQNILVWTLYCEDIRRRLSLHAEASPWSTASSPPPPLLSFSGWRRLRVSKTLFRWQRSLLYFLLYYEAFTNIFIFFYITKPSLYWLFIVFSFKSVINF